MVKHSVNYLTDEVMQGMVSITINNAIDDKIPTSNGDADVIKLDVTIKDSNHNSKIYFPILSLLTQIQTQYMGNLLSQ